MNCGKQPTCFGTNILKNKLADDTLKKHYEKRIQVVNS